MLFVFLIMLCSFAIFKVSIFFTGKISSEITNYVENEYFNCGFITRHFLSTITEDLSDKFCTFFMLSKGFREITYIGLKNKYYKTFIANKNGTSFLLFIFDITEETSPITQAQLYEILGILSRRKVHNCLILADYTSDMAKKIHELKNFNISIYSPLDLVYFYWSNNNYFKERLYDN